MRSLLQRRLGRSWELHLFNAVGTTALLVGSVTVQWWWLALFFAALWGANACNVAILWGVNREAEQQGFDVWNGIWSREDTHAGE